MADMKTLLRELSVIVGFYYCTEQNVYAKEPISFISICKKMLPKVPLIQYAQITKLLSFSAKQIQIINSGFNLSKAIIKKFEIDTIEEVSWYGFDTQKEEPYDISINNSKFSLKEDSFILENMGLYKLLNCYTGSTYKKRHIFSDYARQEYEHWFKVTWTELVSTLNESGTWLYNDTTKNKRSIIKLNKNNIQFRFYKNEILCASSELPIDCSLSIYENNTTAKIREEVFARFINMNLKNNYQYNISKKMCATVVAEALAKELIDNLDYHAGLPRFLKIHNSEYYYAKITKSGIEIYKVPSLSELGHNIIIESIEASVPDKQANILTTIKNTKTGKTLVLRNECRFSHGQFNGTPEAKMYYEHGGSLLTIYEPI